MKLVHDLAKHFDTRLLALGAAIVLPGFGVAHWNGSKFLLEFPEDSILRSIAYAIGFSQACWILNIAIIVVVLVVAAVTRFRADAAKRLVIQLTIVNAIFAAVSFVTVMFLYKTAA